MPECTWASASNSQAAQGASGRAADHPVPRLRERVMSVLRGGSCDAESQPGGSVPVCLRNLSLPGGREGSSR